MGGLAARVARRGNVSTGSRSYDDERGSQERAGGLLDAGIGCTRSDWVGSTLVTVDVTGEWRGTFARGLFRDARS